jgi:hypothetical protein
MGISDSGYSKKPTSGSTQINIPIEVESLSPTAQDFVFCDSKKPVSIPVRRDLTYLLGRSERRAMRPIPIPWISFGL